ncbi:alsin homolog [Scaptodrosophila lebanonensis]|uniref:Alsin homolog n=1 Tax=Drosophila lebanonensis TaxID=7225 RepID=A0A6J2UBP2_DROLE|nr:alsin homolog [Scaptodrosophila lebanonensis]
MSSSSGSAVNVNDGNSSYSSVGGGGDGDVLTKCEAFVIYHEGKTLQLHWQGVPSLTRSPAVRLCSLAPPQHPHHPQPEETNCLFLLTADNSLYLGKLLLKKTTIEFQLLRIDVIDVAFCRGTQELFVVTKDGAVQRQCIVNQTCRPGAWQTLDFDPLGLCADGVRIRRVCCTAQGAVFVSTSGCYVMGTCGDVFNAESEPFQMRLYDEGKELVDLVAGDEHFVLLVAPQNTGEDLLQLPSSKEDREALGGSQGACSSLMEHISGVSSMATLDRASVKSLSSATDSNHTERSFAANARFLLHQGYALLHTQLLTFGASNNGLLGVGDHIRRDNVTRVQKLENMGVCSIGAGREHTVARTLDGRLYHWGLNSRMQLGIDGEDLSVPTEITISDQTPLPKEEHMALEACCGDYRTILLNASGHIQTLPPKQQSTYAQTVLHLQLGAAWPLQLRLLHSAGGFTLHNHRQFQRQYHYYLSHLQSQMQLLLKDRVAVLTLQMWQRQSAAVPALKALEPLLVNWERMLCLLTASLHSLEGYYRADYVQAADLLFVCYHREYIELLHGYVKSYCDIYSVDGFGDAVRAIDLLPSPLAELKEESFLTRLFQQPFHIYQVFIQFMEMLVKRQPEYQEHRVAWAEFASQSCISQELAVSTKEFWSNERNQRIQHFRRRQRRVILTSSMVPLKLASISMSSTTFILFSDCLCQVGGHSLYTYPLTTLWVRQEGETGLCITTPEKSFSLQTRTHENRKVWYDQLQSSILAALGRPRDSRVPSVRCTSYEYSRDHPKYAKVKACGNWRKGVLQGNCYLQYPDESVYFGSILNGVIEGHGKMVIPSNGVYVGSFKGGRFHGHGSYEMNGNEVYEGNFFEGLFHGHGTFRSNRYIYVGEYQANVRCGYGVLEDLQTGDKYMGMFADNKRMGVGICITGRGDYFAGTFIGDELMSTGVAVFENEYYYEGELTLRGPNGKGEYYMPNGAVLKLEDQLSSRVIGEEDNYELSGNKMIGQLSGSWKQVRIQAGELCLNRRFPKYPQSIEKFVVDNNRKWRALFTNFESELENYNANINTSGTGKKQSKAPLSTTQLWNCISAYMSRQHAREVSELQRDTSFFERNILLSFANSSFDKLPQKTAPIKNHALDLLSPPRRIQSQEALCSKDALQRADSLLSMGHNRVASGDCDLNVGSYAATFPLDNGLLSSSFNGDPTRSSQSTLNGSCSSIPNNNNVSKPNNNNNSSCSIASTSTTLEMVPSFGMGSTLSNEDVNAISLYLEQAFKDRHHPLYALNERVANCFHYSYGYWKVKPTSILAKQAMREWESISKRMYRFVRMMFPALPVDYCYLEGSTEVVSHITLLYPLVLSEGIYSTLFVLYANKYSAKDEMYRQNVNYVDRLQNEDLIELLELERNLNAVMSDAYFDEAIQMLKQLQEKFSPKSMLTVIQECMKLLTDAYNSATADNSEQVNGDNMIPLTMLAVLRAAVPHLGAELALLEDLTDGANFKAEMSGLAGYCYTTLKAAYEHVTSKALQKTP